MSEHIPVLRDAVIDLMNIKEGGTYIDATFGRGGYTKALLETSAKVTVIAIDRDPEAIEYGHKQFKQAVNDNRLLLCHGRFSDMDKIVSEIIDQRGTIDGIMMDIGVSSPQIDEAKRGFSFQESGPLDMRMDTSSSDPTAADLVNELDEVDLKEIIKTYGEERHAGLVARAIVKRRQEKPFETTDDLAQLIEKTIPDTHKSKIPPATRTFQALRIAVNDELGELERGLEAALTLLKEGGRIAVVSFHSLEDRIVKQFFKEQAGETKSVSRYLPVPDDNDNARIKIITKKPITADQNEISQNPRARSAKLRCAELIQNSGEASS